MEARYDWEMTRRFVWEALKLLPEGASLRILDVGSGPGTWRRAICEERKCNYVCIDLCESMVRKAAFPHQQSFQGVVGDAERLPFRTGVFDLVVSIHLMEYLDNLKSFAEEVKRVLVPNGLFLLITKNKQALIWRAAKRLADLFVRNPLVQQKWFHFDDIQSLLVSVGFLVAKTGGISLRLPTRFNDLNDKCKWLRAPRFLANPILRLTSRFETQSVEWTRCGRFFFWHFGLIVRARG